MVEPFLKLSLTAEYAPHWRTREGIREIIQNWYDGVTDAFGRLCPPPTQGEPPLWSLRVRNEPSDRGALIAAVALRVNRSGQSIGDEGKLTLGTITHNKADNTLAFENEHVDLQRQVLLLGHSSKRDRKDQVGQFGEGMKVGILALLREDHSVEMATNGEGWNFELYYDPIFDTRVLAVFACQARTPQGCTSTVVGNISGEFWAELARDYLFLRPTQMVTTDLGDLLLGDEFKHKLYVKQFWVADLPEQLEVGVNLRDLAIDRDRRAVTKVGELQQKISNVWALAIHRDSSLIPKYMELLQNFSHGSEVSNGIWYLTDHSIDGLVNQFFESHGPGAVPVLNTQLEDAMLIEQLGGNQTPVLCPKVLYDILAKSKRITPAPVLLEKHACEHKSTAVASLPPDDLAVLHRGILLLRALDPLFGMGDIEICSFNSEEVIASKREGGGVHLDRRILDLTFTHSKLGSCGLEQAAKEAAELGRPAPAKCVCREVHVAFCVMRESTRHRLQPVPLASGRSRTQTEKTQAMLVRLLEKVSRGWLEHAHKNDSHNESTVVHPQQAKDDARLSELELLTSQLSGHNLTGLPMAKLNELERIFLDAIASVARAKEACLRQELEAARERLAQAEANHMCRVCLANEFNVVFLPCAHMAVCKTCSPSLTHCPICRAFVETKFETF